MGTDLHVMVEVSHNGQPFHPLMHAGTAYLAPREYAFFSFMADVRNGSGRGTRTWQEPSTHYREGEAIEVPGFWYDTDIGGHDKIVPIDVPRGVPEDASEEWKRFAALWYVKSNDVVTSWLTIEDILAGDWDQEVLREGIVTEEDYLAYRDEGTIPELWADQAGGEGMRIVNEEEYAAGVRGERETSVKFRWNAGTLRSIHAGFLEMIADMAANKPDTTTLRFMLLFES